MTALNDESHVKNKKGSVSHKMTSNKFAAYPVPCLEFSCLLLFSTKLHYTVGTLIWRSICHWQHPTFHSWKGKERDLMSKKDDFQMSPLLRIGKFFRVRQHESERKIRDKSPTVSRYELRSHTIPSFFFLDVLCLAPATRLTREYLPGRQEPIDAGGAIFIKSHAATPETCGLHIVMSLQMF